MTLGASLLSVPAFLGIDIPSVSDILRSIANDLFKVLAGAFLPGWLRHAPAQTLRWLIALPDPGNAVQWPTMHRLERDTTSVAVAFVPLTVAIAAARYTASGVLGGVHHPAESLGRVVGAGFGLVIFPWAFSNVIAAVNVTTSALLGFADVSHGLERALALMFTGGLLFGVTGPLIALLVIGAILLAAGLFVMKVGILALFAVLFVAGPLALAAYPIPELHGAFRLWSGLVVALAAIPIGWCVIFATAGAISADITHLGTPAAIGTRLVGFFAGVLTFFIAFRWPFFLIGMVRSRGLLSTDLGTGATHSSTGTGATMGQRAAQGRVALTAAAGTVGGAVSAAGAAAGLPRGGLASAAGRAATRGAGRVAGAPSVMRYRDGGAAAWDSLRDRAAGSRLGRSGGGRRIAAAGSVLASTPAAVRATIANCRAPDGGRAAGEATLASVAAGDGSSRPANGSPDTHSRWSPSPGHHGSPASGQAAATGDHGTPHMTAATRASAARASIDATAVAGAAAAASAVAGSATARPAGAGPNLSAPRKPRPAFPTDPAAPTPGPTPVRRRDSAEGRARAATGPTTDPSPPEPARPRGEEVV
jgi:hypothetical protein